MTRFESYKCRDPLRVRRAKNGRKKETKRDVWEVNFWLVPVLVGSAARSKLAYLPPQVSIGCCPNSGSGARLWLRSRPVVLLQGLHIATCMGEWVNDTRSQRVHTRVSSKLPKSTTTTAATTTSMNRLMLIISERQKWCYLFLILLSLRQGVPTFFFFGPDFACLCYIGLCGLSGTYGVFLVLKFFFFQYIWGQSFFFFFFPCVRNEFPPGLVCPFRFPSFEVVASSWFRSQYYILILLFVVLFYYYYHHYLWDMPSEICH